MLRPSEVVQAFGRRFSLVRFFPLVSYAERMQFGNVHSDWSGYQAQNLTTANGILVAVK